METVNDQNVNPVYEEPEDVNSWSWGAFLLSGLWGLFNGIYWPFFTMLGLGIMSGLIGSAAVSWIVLCVDLVIAIYLGITGRSQAWAVKEWKSPEQFVRVQRNWAIAGFVLTALYIAFYVVALESLL